MDNKLLYQLLNTMQLDGDVDIPLKTLKEKIDNGDFDLEYMIDKISKASKQDGIGRQLKVDIELMLQCLTILAFKHQHQLLETKEENKKV
jgi:hypothetical protein